MVQCPACQTQKQEEAFIETYLSSFNNQEYKLYHCQNCDLQWWEPLRIIPEFYEAEGEEAYELFHTGLRETMVEWHKPFFKYISIKSGRLLDVGCGDGVFLKAARKAGFEVWGIDFDSKSIKVCQEKLGLKKCFVMTPQEFAEFCQNEGLKFDVITFFEVLEHQDKPKAFLEAIKSILKSGGDIAGSVPNRDSWFMKMSRKIYTQGDSPPHHFLRFSEEALYNFYKMRGFEEIFINSTPVKIKDIVPILQVYFTGNKINKFLRKKITTHELAVKGTSIYKNLPFWRKVIFKSLKGLRFLIFFFPALAIKYTSKGFYLYFQCRV